MNESASFNDHYMSSTAPQSSDLFIISPARRKGIQSGLMTTLYEQLVSFNKSVVMYDYLYFIEKREASENYQIEFVELKAVFNKLRFEHPTNKIHLVGHSLGGAISSWMAKDKPLEVASVGIFGFLPEMADFGTFTGPVHIVQGDFDDYGDEDAVRTAMESFSTQFTIDTIADADHLFRGTGYDTDVNYERDAVNEYIKHIL